MKTLEEYPDFFVDDSLFGFMIVDDTKEADVLKSKKETEEIEEECELIACTK